MDPKSHVNGQNGPWKGRKKVRLGLFRPSQGLVKYKRSLKGSSKCSRRVGEASRRVWKAFEGIWGHFGVILGLSAIWTGHLGHVRVSRNRLDLAGKTAWVCELIRKKGAFWNALPFVYPKNTTLAHLPPPTMANFCNRGPCRTALDSAGPPRPGRRSKVD